MLNFAVFILLDAQSEYLVDSCPTVTQSLYRRVYAIIDVARSCYNFYPTKCSICICHLLDVQIDEVNKKFVFVFNQAYQAKVTAAFNRLY